MTNITHIWFHELPSFSNWHLWRPVRAVKSHKGKPLWLEFEDNGESLFSKTPIQLGLPLTEWGGVSYIVDMQLKLNI